MLAQNNLTNDGFDLTMQQISMVRPTLKEDIAAFNKTLEVKATQQSVYKTTGTGIVPVIFHIVLTPSQLSQIGDSTNIEERIADQLQILNNDFNAANTDTSKIPAAFKPLYGSMGIQFALAHKDPQNNYTRGYEVISTTKTGFNIQNGTTGSGYACSDAKFASTGGADAWDAHLYLNIWITSITPAGVGGVGMPPPYAAYGGVAVFPWNEQGIVISYMAFGKKTATQQFFPIGTAVAGRTLVHETGHFFNLFHTCGISTFDNVTCTDDDGVKDTPPQRAPTSGFPAFPVLDTCSPAAPGVMFVNHMDYTSDTGRVMFTAGQSARSNLELQSGGFRNSLLQHPELIYYWPAGINKLNNTSSFTVYPNPVHDICRLSFDNNTQPQQILLFNALGQIVEMINTTNNIINMQTLPKGMYIIKCVFPDHTLSSTIMKD